MKKTDKKNKKAVFLPVLMLSIVLMCSCSKNEQKNNTATPSVNETVKPNTDSGNTPTSGTEVKENTAEDNISSAPDTTEAPVSPTPELSVSDIPEVPTEIPVTTETPAQERDRFDRSEYWERSFLVWLPMFDRGTFSGQDSAGTFDYAVFTEVTYEDVTDYISKLKSSGFSNVSTEQVSGDTVNYEATNDNSWQVKLKFSDNNLVLGSGFEDSEIKEDKAEKMFTSTMLQYLPRFDKGTYSSSESLSDSTMYAKIIYTDVTRDEASEYIELVKNAGYIYGTDEGNDGESLWYIALNEESFECHIEFSGHELMIGCGNMKEE